MVLGAEGGGDEMVPSHPTQRLLLRLRQGRGGHGTARHGTAYYSTTTTYYTVCPAQSNPLYMCRRVANYILLLLPTTKNKRGTKARGEISISFSEEKQNKLRKFGECSSLPPSFVCLASYWSRKLW